LRTANIQTPSAPVIDRTPLFPARYFLGAGSGVFLDFGLEYSDFLVSPTAWAWSLSSPYCATTYFLPPSISVKTPGYCQGFLRNQ
jgi:hypothetical protein